MTETKKEKEESERVAQLIKRMDALDSNYVNNESAVIAQKQPFLISLLLGYRFDMKETELEEVMRIIFLIWEYFKGFHQIGKVKISETQYERLKLKNLEMLEYLEGEQSTNGQKAVVSSDINHLKSKALFTGVLVQLTHKKALVEMKSEQKGLIVLDMKTLVECFDEITKR